MPTFGVELTPSALLGLSFLTTDLGTSQSPYSHEPISYNILYRDIDEIEIYRYKDFYRKMITYVKYVDDYVLYINHTYIHDSL